MDFIGQYHHLIDLFLFILTVKRQPVVQCMFPNKLEERAFEVICN